MSFHVWFSMKNFKQLSKLISLCNICNCLLLTFIYSHLLCTFMEITCFISPKTYVLYLRCNLIIRLGHFINGRNFGLYCDNVSASLPEISFLNLQRSVYKYNVGIKIIVRYTINVLVYGHLCTLNGPSANCPFNIHLRYYRMFTLGLQSSTLYLFTFHIFSTLYLYS